MTTQTYQGYTNYETWLVDLWLSSDVSLYQEVQNLITEDTDCSDSEIAGKIKEYVEYLIDEQDIQEGFVKDLVNSALSEVNWLEIAEVEREE